MKRLTHSLSSQHTFHSIKALALQNLFPQALKVSTSLHNPHLTATIYGLFIKSGFVLHPFLATSLITHFSLSSDFSRAAQFLRDTHCPDTVVFNSLISGYARFSNSGPVFDLFNQLRQLGLAPDGYTLSALIKGCETLEQNEIAHGVSIKMGFFSSVYLVSGLVENYSKSGSVNSAEKCFEECVLFDSVVWTAMISGYVCNKEFERGREIFTEMRALGLELNEFSLTSVLGALFEVKEGEQIHGFSVKLGLLCGCSIHLNNAILNMYCRCGSKLDAIKMFDEIPNPDVVSWMGRISAAHDGVEALEIFKFCCLNGVEMNDYTVTNVLSSIEGPKFLKPGKQIHALCYKSGYLLVVSVCNALISMYGKCMHMADAKCAFDEMVFQDSVSWNSLIACLSENCFVGEAIATFSQMRSIQVQPNKYTLATILDAVSNLNSPRETMQIHSLVIKLGFLFDISMLSCLISVYGKCNGIDESKRVFEDIDEVNVVHLNTMTATLVHAGYHIDALTLFQTTRRLSLDVDSVTVSLVLKACGALTDMEQGRAIHSLALKYGIHEDSFVKSAIIDTYCKCGSMDEAEKAFRNIKKDNLAAWNAMLMGYAQIGCYYNVLVLFTKMCESGMNPDEITYLGVLSSCCHAGLVNEARSHLISMFELHGVIPSLEHYACMVDMFGRVGLLEQAKQTIDQMPIYPDARIWQILLYTCNIHGNVALGKLAAGELLELQPENESAYILLSNLYASAGMWDEVAELRREMKEKIVFKEPGSSWIQVRGSTHYFLAGDKSHPESKEVYARLQSLNKQILPLLELEEDGISSMDVRTLDH